MHPAAIVDRDCAGAIARQLHFIVALARSFASAMLGLPGGGRGGNGAGLAAGGSSLSSALCSMRMRADSGKRSAWATARSAAAPPRAHG